MNHFLSREFFHLVGRRTPEDDERKFGTLKSILADECIRYPGAAPAEARTSVTVDLTKTLASGELIVPTITCYCDIPPQSIDFHARKYGRFGLSFDKDFLIGRGARPVMYVPMRSDDASSAHGRTLLRDMEAIYHAFRNKLVDPLVQQRRRVRSLGRQPNTTDGVVDALDTLLTFQFLSFVKPYDSELPETHTDYFYSERESRMTNCLRFVPPDVVAVVVADGYADRFIEELPRYREKVTTVPNRSG